jgi:addiction module HigA family antidote
MRMNNHRHSSRNVRQQGIEPLDVTVTLAAPPVAVTRQNLNNVLNGKLRISHEMAVSLSKAFGSRGKGMAWSTNGISSLGSGKDGQ